MSCGVGRRCGLDPMWLWLWCRPVATVLIQPLAWEPPYAVGAASEMAKRQKTKQKQTKKPKNKTKKKGNNPHSKIIPLKVRGRLRNHSEVRIFVY